MLTEVVVAPEGKKLLARALPGISLSSTPQKKASDLLVVTPVDSALTALSRLTGATPRGRVVLAMVGHDKIDPTKLADAFAFAEREHCTPFYAKDLPTARRLILAHKRKASDRLIASASVRGSELVVWSCEPKQYVVPLASLPGVCRLSRAAQQKMTLDEDGARLSWPQGDIDLDLDAIRYAADPAFKKQADKKTRTRLRSYASAIRALRKSHGLGQAQVKGLTDRQVRRIEAGLVVPHAATLEKLATAHGMSLETYLNALAALG